MNKNILIIKLTVTLVSLLFVAACSSHSKHAIDIQLLNNKIVIHNDMWAKDIIMSNCDASESKKVPFKVDSIRGEIFIYNPCCYLKSIDLTSGNIVDSLRIKCYGGEKDFEISTYDDFIVLSSSQRLWIIKKSKLDVYASLIDTINEYRPICFGNLYSFVPLVIADSLIVDLMYKTDDDSSFTYQVCFRESFSFPRNPYFYKIPKKDFIIPSVEDTIK